MINSDVPLTVKRRVNVRGGVIAIDPEGPVSEAAWTKERLARAKQTLPNGYCGLPLGRAARTPTPA